MTLSSVTACFLAIVTDPTRGGVAQSTRQGGIAHEAAMCVWMAAVFTSMLFVERAIPTSSY